MIKLKYVLPQNEHVSPKAILKFIEELETLNIHSFMIARNGNILAEGYFDPYQKDDLHMMYSLSKTFTAVAICFLVQEGKLSFQDLIINIFKDKDLRHIDKNMKKITVEHLLTMSTGHQKEPIGIIDSTDPVQYFLNTAVENEPGTLFVYNTPASFILSAIVTQITGENVYDYLTPRLFEPLSIHDIWWQTENNISAGGYGLNLSTKDILKFGQFLLNKGSYNHQQLLDAQYIEQLSSKHSDTSAHDKAEWKHGYGYQCWLCREPNSFRADGAFGQFCVIIPKYQCVVAITSGENNNQKTMDAIFDILLKGMDTDDFYDLQDQILLDQKIEQLKLPCPSGYKNSLMGNLQNGKTYEMEDNPLKIKSLTFHFEKENSITFVTDQATFTIETGHFEWQKGTLPIKDPHTLNVEEHFYHQYASSSCFANGFFRFDIWYTNTPYKDTYMIRFNEDHILVDYQRNGSFLFTDIGFKGTLKDGQ